jgi:hypothetical protein
MELVMTTGLLRLFASLLASAMAGLSGLSLQFVLKFYLFFSVCCQQQN